MNSKNCIKQVHNDKWSMYNGDCVEMIKNIPDDSIGMTIYSPPFSNLYIYSDSDRDMGNCANDDEFFEHYKFLIKELYRSTEAGRVSVVHCKDLPAYYHRDGYSGLIDFPGRIIKAHEDCGWSYHSRVTVWKCPVVERERTNNNGLLHKTVMRDRSQLRQGMPDYLLVFRKTPTDGLMAKTPVGDKKGFTMWHGEPESDPRVAGSHHPSKYARKSIASNDSINLWRRYAEPVWWDVDQREVLNRKQARTDKDEKHICPLQLGVIRRAVALWSQPNDIVLSPFAGIGSEGFESIKLGRKFVGFELKEAYFDIAVANLAKAEEDQKELF